jgi:hypothetical protein
MMSNVGESAWWVGHPERWRAMVLDLLDRHDGPPEGWAWEAFIALVQGYELMGDVSGGREAIAVGRRKMEDERG